MSFGSTLTLTVNSVAKVLNRINQDNYGSEYYLRSTLDEYRVKIRHSKEKANPDGTQLDRHNIEVTQIIYATSTTPVVTRQFYIVARVPTNDDLTAAGYLFAASATYFGNGTVESDLLTWQS
jgi:hypothetical protein